IHADTHGLLMNILFVENHPVFAETVTRQFLSRHCVTVAPSLSAARQALVDAAFDVLLVDYDLDDGKGDELIEELRASGRAVTVIGVSSHDEGNSALLRAGAVSICSKTRFDRIQGVIDVATARVNSDRVKETGMLWWVIAGALAAMPMPFIHPERRLNMGGPLTAYEDELPALYGAGIRAVVSLLNIPLDASVYESAGFAFLCLPMPDGGAPSAQQAQVVVGFIDRHLTGH